MARWIENKESAARDFLALEKTFLSHLKLASLLSLLSTSILERIRIPGRDIPKDSDIEKSLHIPLGSIYAALALATLYAGVRRYRRHSCDLMLERAFFRPYV